MIIDQKPYGIYNVTNPGSVKTEEVVEMLKERFVFDKSFKYFTDLNEFNETIKAPRSNCVLNTYKLSSVGIKMRPVREALQDSIKNWS